MKEENVKYNLAVEDSDGAKKPELHVTIASQTFPNSSYSIPSTPEGSEDSSTPALVSISRTSISQNISGDNLCIDEDYDN